MELTEVGPRFELKCECGVYPHLEEVKEERLV